MFFLPEESWEVRKVKDKGRGIFATREIEPGTIIGDYLGKVISTADEDKIEEENGFYLMSFHDKASIFPDLNTPGIHLLNHSCSPICWMYTYHGHTLFFALRRIFPGEELTINYLLSPQDKYCKPCTHLCSCGSLICRHTMHLSPQKYEKWTAHHEKEIQKTKKVRVRYGQDLPRLKSYPSSLPDNPIYTLFGSDKKHPEEYTDSQLPSLSELRRRIRETGKIISFPSLNLKIFGIEDTSLIATPLS